MDQKGHKSGKVIASVCVCDWHDFFFKFQTSETSAGGAGFSGGSGKVMTRLAAQGDSSTSLGSSDRGLYLLILSVNNK